ncbi:hypothetical protein IKB17_02730 [bacterium]|nr:hypothetical protein [bacterium]
MSGGKNYEIRISNQGITYELKKLVEKEFPNSIMSDGNISASEWQATLEELKNINDERTSSNKKSIFGGCDNTDNPNWQSCFIVKMGDVIQFTRDEMNRLLNAMGITVNNDSNSLEVDDPASVETQLVLQNEEVNEGENLKDAEEVEVVEVTEDVAELEEPQNEVKAEVVEEAEDVAEVKADPKNESVQITQDIKEANNNVIENFWLAYSWAKDQGYAINSETYDNDGRIISFVMSKDSDKRDVSISYNDGKLSKISTIKKGNNYILGTWEQDFNAEGSLEKDIAISYLLGKMFDAEVTTYDANGQLRSADETTYYTNGTKKEHSYKEYDENGQLRSDLKTTYDKNGQPRSADETTYDKNGTKMKYSYKEYGENGQLYNADETTYDKNGTERKYSSKFYYEDGQLLSDLKTTYDKNGTKKKYSSKTYYENGQLSHAHETTYDKDGTEKDSWMKIFSKDGQRIEKY